MREGYWRGEWDLLIPPFGLFLSPALPDLAFSSLEPCCRALAGELALSKPPFSRPPAPDAKTSRLPTSETVGLLGVGPGDTSAFPAHAAALVAGAGAASAGLLLLLLLLSSTAVAVGCCSTPSAWRAARGDGDGEGGGGGR